MVLTHPDSFRKNQLVIYQAGWHFIMDSPLTLAWLIFSVALLGIAIAYSGFHHVVSTVILEPIYYSVSLLRTYLICQAEYILAKLVLSVGYLYCCLISLWIPLLHMPVQCAAVGGVLCYKQVCLIVQYRLYKSQVAILVARVGHLTAWHQYT